MTGNSRNVLLFGAVVGAALLGNIYFFILRTSETTELTLTGLLEERRALDETVWAQEVAAQKHEQTIVKYWDQMLRPEDDKYAVLAKFPFQSITLDAPGETTELDWGIKRTVSGGEWKTLDRAGWRDFLRDMEQRGYAIDAIEFHQTSYEVDEDENAVSVFNVLLNAENKDAARRWSIQTKLRVEWTGETDAEGLYIPGGLTLFDTTILEREGPEAFEHRILETEIRPFAHPIVYDLDRDGASDIVLPSHNMVLRNRGDGQFEEQELFSRRAVASLNRAFPSIVADFDGDGNVDLLTSGLYNIIRSFRAPSPTIQLALFRGDGRAASPRRVNMLWRSLCL